ncbi:MAG: flippase-like domain-containing protein [Acidobacteriota bacterium]
MRRLVGRFAGAIIAAALLAAVLAAARPSEIWRLFTSTQPLLLAAAGAASLASVAMRGLRLKLLLDGRSIGLLRATLVAAAAQAAALFAPVRTGEIALPWLLSRSTGRDFASNFGTLLAARTLDVATLGIWSAAAVLAVRGFGEPAAQLVSLLLLAPPLALPLTLSAADRLMTRVLAPRGLRGRRWTRRVRRVRREIDALGRRPGRLVAAAAASLAMWAFQWVVTWSLLAGMGFPWPPTTVVAGSVGASVANLMPFNIVGNLGTFEAGWTAVFSALGVPLQEAAATGVAAHLWGLALAALLGAAAWTVLVWNGHVVGGRQGEGVKRSRG